MLLKGLLITVLAIHWVADFVCQSRWMGCNKSKSLKILGYHTLLYTMILTAVTSMLCIPLWYGLVNGVLHGAIDYKSSKVTSKLWDLGEDHNFWVVIGLDQLVHVSLLVLLLPV